MDKNQNRWSIYTKDDLEFTGERLTYNDNAWILYHTRKQTRFFFKRDWRALWLLDKKEEYEEIENIYDYIISQGEVFRIERNDTEEAEMSEGEMTEEWVWDSWEKKLVRAHNRSGEGHG